MLDLLPSPTEVLELAPRVAAVMDVGDLAADGPVDLRDIALCLDDGMVVGLNDPRWAQVAEGSAQALKELTLLLGRPVNAERAALLMARCRALVGMARHSCSASEDQEPVTTPAKPEVRSPPSIEDLEAEMERAMAQMETRAGRRLA